MVPIPVFVFLLPVELGFCSLKVFLNFDQCENTMSRLC